MIIYLIWSRAWTTDRQNPLSLIGTYVMGCASFRDDRDAIIGRIDTEHKLSATYFGDGFTTRPFRLERAS